MQSTSFLPRWCPGGHEGLPTSGDVLTADNVEHLRLPPSCKVKGMPVVGKEGSRM